MTRSETRLHTDQAAGAGQRALASGSARPVRSPKTYRPPRLTAHGRLAQVTRMGGSFPTESGTGNLGPEQP